MSRAGDLPIAYVLKRYPRLSETFIVNEIRAMERLGAKIHIFSLLPPEPPPHHPMVGTVAASVEAIPDRWHEFLRVVAKAHLSTLRAAPLGYLRAAARALGWAVTSGKPWAVARNFARAGFVAAGCRSRGIGHLHAHFINTPAAVTLLASLMTELPFSVTAHAKDLYLSPRRAVRRYLAAAEFVATCTQYNADYLRSVARPVHCDRIHPIYHGIDLDAFSAATTEPPPAAHRSATILSVGRLVPKKGHDDLIAACALLRAAGERVQCTIVGEGPERSALEAAVAAAGLGDTVTLPGAMTHKELIERYRSADIFVLAPRVTADGDRDGIPNVIAEAMAMGLPVLSTAVSGVPELVKDGETGLLVEPGDRDALARGMRRLLGDRALGAALAAAAQARLRAEFDLWSTTRRLHELFGVVADERRLGASRPDSSRSTVGTAASAE